jgi:serine/threonine protein kinase
MSDDESIFAEAISIESSEQRRAFLDQACAGDAGLRREIEELLRAHDRAGEFLSVPPVTLQMSDPLIEQSGTVLGHYKLLEQIGEGGMGVVFMAEQFRPIKRRVALKIIKPGLDTRQTLARFEAERQALAMMDHPSIAKVFDAGATPQGRPYFVMELVRGIPITEYCDQHHLTPRQRLELFVQVCQAVQHAHQKGIIHRDLKPNNVLITLQDGDKPIPKVIDFGIAKAAGEQRLTDRTLFTEFRQLIGTPLYMSPEQAEMSQLTDVDTRSDIYSLGVLLYELLTGTTPFDKTRLAKAACDEIRRIIREEEPPRPSTRLSTLGGTLATVSAQRSVEARKLGQLIHGELDWIVMKALEKERARRYETANAMARDVERYLTDQPVEACPPSRTYRLRKLVRRNKTAIATAATVVLILLAATVVSAWQAVRATRAGAATLAARAQIIRERDQAQAERHRADEQAAVAKAVNRFMNEDVLGQADPYAQILANAQSDPDLKGLPNTKPDPDLKVRDALDRAARRIAGRFKAQPLVEAATREQIGDAYLALGQNAAAEEQFQFALRLRRQTQGDQHADTLRTLHRLALASRRGKGIEILLGVLESQRKILGDQHPDTLDTMNDLAQLYWHSGEYSKAEPLMEKVVEAKRKILPETALERLYAEYGLADLQSIATHMDGKIGGNGASAMPLLRQILEQVRKAYGEEDPRTLGTLRELAWRYHSSREYDKAVPLLSQAVNGMRKTLGPQHPQTLSAIGELADVYQNMGQLAKAEPMLRELGEWCLVLPTERVTTAMTVIPRLIRCYRDLNQPAKVTQWQQNLRLFLEADLVAKTAEIKQASDDQRLSDSTLAARAFDYQMLARFPDAIVDRTRCIQLDPANIHAWSELAYLQLYLGNESAYHDACGGILRQFGDTSDRRIAALAARTCLITLSAMDDPALRLADTAAALGVYPDKAISLTTIQMAKGIAELRRGHFSEAADWLGNCSTRTQVLLDTSRRFVRDVTLIPEEEATTNYFLAMAEYRRGNMQEAWHALAMARGQHQVQVPPVSSGDWKLGEPEWLMVQIAARQAQELLGQRHPAMLAAINAVAACDAAGGKYAMAEPLFVQALSASRSDSPESTEALYNLAWIYSEESKDALAEPLLIKLLEARRKTSGDQSPATLDVIELLIRAYRRLGPQYIKAAPLVQEYAQGARKLYGEQSPEFLWATRQMADLYLSERRDADAEPLLRQQAEAALADPGGRLFTQDTTINLGRLADCYRRLGREDDALAWERHLREYLLTNIAGQTQRIRSLQPDDNEAGILLMQRAESCRRLGHLNDALTDLEARLRFTPSAYATRGRVAALQAYRGDEKAYRITCRELLQQFDKQAGQAIHERARSTAEAVLLTAGAADDAAITRVVDRLAATWTDPTNTDYLLLYRGKAAYRCGRFDSALELLTQSRDALAAEAGRFRLEPFPCEEDLVQANSFLAMAEHQLGHEEQARLALTAARTQLQTTVAPIDRPSDKVGTPAWLAAHIALREAEALIGKGVRATAASRP